jgi:cell division protein YceG involved in septum cleavage
MFDDDLASSEPLRGAPAGRSRRRAAIILGGLLAVSLLLVVIPFGGGEDEEPSTAAGVEVAYEVRAGQTVRSVGDELVELDVIDSALRFRRIAEEQALARVLRPGPYVLATGMSEEEAVAVLAAGPLRELSRPTARVQVI